MALSIFLILAACASPSDAPSADAPHLPVPKHLHPFPGVLTGGQPSIKNLEVARHKGFRSVINLRVDGESGSLPTDKEAARALGMRYVSIPIAGAADYNIENAQRLADALEGTDRLPALVHCGSGNRVGALFAIKAFHLDGKGVEESIEIGKSAGLTKSEPAIRKILSGSEE